MTNFPKRLQQKLSERKATNAFRRLGTSKDLIDFSSNDYLGLGKSKTIFEQTSALLETYQLQQNGATGSRLLSGNHELYTTTEAYLQHYHRTEGALIFNSGYDANVGFFSSVPQRGDIIWYDELCHASIRDGITMSRTKAYKFPHNNLEALRKALSARVPSISSETTIYIVTESVFSMDGDRPNLAALVKICQEFNAFAVVDEAHALGVFGEKGAGCVQELGLEEAVFARIVTFGKGLGCHGAAILGSAHLKDYLVNFARSFVYSTGLPPHSVAAIQMSYQAMEEHEERRKILISNIAILRREIISNSLQSHFIESESAIHCCVISGNDRVKKISEALQKRGYDVRPILSPTVHEGQERLRICVHSFNTVIEISNLIKHLKALLL